MGVTERRLREKEELRTAILSTAWQMVKEDGWQSLSIRKIADAIEYSVPVIYEHFESKEAILLEFSREGFKSLLKKLEQAKKKSESPAEQLRALADAYWYFAFRNREYYQLMFGLGMACCEQEKTMPEITAFRDLVMEPINAILAKSDKKGVMPCLKYHTFWSIIHGLISIKMMSSSDVSDELNKMVLDDAIEGFIKKFEELAMNKLSMKNMRALQLSVLLLCSLVALHSCKPSGGNTGWGEQPPQELPVFTVSNIPATIYREYSASIEGTSVVEIRPQVEGTLEKIYADEGAYVKKGQSLFQINDRPYREQLENARAGLAAAKANLSNAEINVKKLEPLVKNKVISDVQLKTAQAAYDAAAASAAQAEAMMRNAEINVGYTLIKAPVDGYIGRIPFKVGSLVGMGMVEPLTVLSETKEVYAYFSLSETDFMQFKNEFARNTMEEKIKQVPPVELVLADGSIYPLKGKVETVSGQFSASTGTISFRAVFENPDGMLRSGNTGKVRIPRQMDSALVIPQESTYELQDKVFVFVLADSNKVASVPITVAGTSGNYYLVDKGIKSGDKVVYSGIDRLRDDAVIQPVPMSLDSLLKARPL